MDPNDPRMHTLSLTSNDPVNTPVVEYEKWLLVTKSRVRLDVEDDVLSDRLLGDLGKAFSSLQLHKVDDWRRQQERMRLGSYLESFSGSVIRPAVCASVKTGTCPGSVPLVGAYIPLQMISLDPFPLIG